MVEGTSAVIGQLELYNTALRLLGERELSDLTEAREPRYRLDSVWDLGAVNHCLEVVKPRFACTVAKLDSPTTSTEHAFTSVHSLPGDYIALAGLFSDDKLDEPIPRFIVDGRTVACDFATVYVRYVRDPADYTVWTQSFAMAVASYLAKQIAPRLAPDQLPALSEIHADYVKTALELNGVEEPMPRAKPPTASLTQDWLHIYNEALFIMGHQQLISVNDASDTRAALDAAVSQRLVQDELEDTGWQWAIHSHKMDYNPSLEPAWGYRRVFDLPDDFGVMSGLFYDEYMQRPIKAYALESDRVFCEEDVVYLQYIDLDTIAEPSNWPAYFRRLISAALAKRTALVLGGNLDAAMAAYHECERRAKANDLRDSPPRKIQNGSWTRARMSGEGNRRRP